MNRVRIFRAQSFNLRWTTLLFCAAPLFIWSQAGAQPEISRENVPSASGVSMEYYRNTARTVAVDVGTAGGPRIWDYSQGSTADSVSETVVESSLTPYGPQFPGATLVYETNGLNIAGIDTASGYQYMNLDESGLELLGAASGNVLGIPVSLVLDSALTLLTLPLEYGSSWTDEIDYAHVFEDVVENPDPSFLFPDPYLDVLIELEITTTGEADAWGTVMVPFGDFETLRVRRDDWLHVRASVFFTFLFVPVYDTTFTSISYDWYVKNLGSVLTVRSKPDETDPNFTEASRVRRLKGTNAAPSVTGDVNCDGLITPGDALCAFWRSILDAFQEECLCDQSVQASDINCDGHVTPGDALCIFWRSILGEWQVECGCPEQPGLTFFEDEKNAAIKIEGASMVFDISPSLETTGCPGDDILVPIILTDPPDSIDAFSFRMSYPISLLSFTGIDVSGTLTQDWTMIDSYENTPGVVTIGGFTVNATETPGVFVNIRFRVDEGGIGQGSICLSDFVDDLEGASSECGVFSSEHCPTSVDGNFDISIPTSFSLEQNYPNPFNATTAISYQLSAVSEQTTHHLSLVTLKVYNLLGQEVKTLVSEVQAPGFYSVTWDGRDVPSGIYYYVLSVNGGQWRDTKTLVLMK